MKKILLYSAALTLAISCVDERFDLSDVNVGDVAIGSDESRFKIPLANITVKADAIQGEDGSLKSILRDADLLIPESIEILDLQNPPVDAMVEALFERLRNDEDDEDKDFSRKVANFLEESEYRDKVEAALPPELHGLDFDIVFTEHFDALYDRQELRDELRRVIEEYFTSINKILPTVNVEMDGFGIEDDMIELLTGTGAIRIYGTVENSMPIDGNASLVLVKNDGSDILTLDLPLDYAQRTKDFSVTIDNDALRGMAENMTMQVSLNLASYYPHQDFLSDEDDTVVMKLVLKLEKQGGLNISDLID